MLRAEQSRALWEELESETGVQLLDLVGGVDHGVDDHEVRAFEEQFRRHGIDHEVLDPAEATERWPGMRFETKVLYQPRSGRALADQALTAIRESARTLGVEFRPNCPVTALKIGAGTAGEGPVDLDTPAGAVRAGQVVVTAGPWAPRILGGGQLELPAITVSQEQPRFFAPLDPGMTWPVFVHRRRGGDPLDAATSTGCSRRAMG